MKLNLATKIQDFSRQFKMNEEKYMRNYQELVGDHTKYDFSDDGVKTKTNSSTSLTNDFLQMNESNSVLKKRDDEINTLLNSIGELAGVFKDMQTLVVEQGILNSNLFRNYTRPYRLQYRQCITKYKRCKEGISQSR